MAETAFIYDPRTKEVQEIEAKDLDIALRGGALPATGEEIQILETQKLLDAKYGSTGQRILGEAENIASQLTLGGSTVALRALGVNPEGLRERDKRSSTAVAVAANVVPVIATGGGSLLAKGGAVALKEGAEAAVKAGVKEGVEAAAKKGVAGTVAGAAKDGLAASGPAALFRLEQSIAQGIAPAGSGLARRAAGQAVGSVVSGTAVTAGELVNEAALGNPVELGEDTFKMLGAGALLGGTGGAAFELAGGALSATARATRKASTKLFQQTVEKYGEHAKRLFPDEAAAIDDLLANRADLVARGPRAVEDAITRNRAPVSLVDPGPAPVKPDLLEKPDLPEAYQKQPLPDELEFVPGTAPTRPVRPEPAPVEVEEADVLGVADTLTEMLKKSDEAGEVMFKHLRPAERAALIDDVVIDRVAAQDVAVGLLKKGDEILEQLKAEPGRYGSGIIAKFEEALEVAKKEAPGLAPPAPPKGKVKKGSDVVTEALAGARKAKKGAKTAEGAVPVEAPAKATNLQMFAALDELKRGLSERGLSRNHAIRAFYTDVRDALTDSTVWNQSAARQREINKAYTALSALTKRQSGKGQKGEAIKFFFTSRIDPATGKTEWYGDPTKISKFLKNLGKPENAAKERAFAEMNRVIKGWTDQVEQSAKHMPGQFERGVVDETLARVREKFDAAQAMRAAQAREAAERAAHLSDAKALKDELDAFFSAEKARKGALAAEKKAFEKGETAKYNERVRERNAVKQERNAIGAENAARTQAFKAETEAFKLRAAEARLSNKDLLAAEREAIKDSMARLQGSTVPGMSDVIGLGAGAVHPLLGAGYAAMRLRAFLDSPAKAIRALGIVERAGQQTVSAIERLTRSIALGVKVGAGAARLGAAAGYAHEAAKARRKFDSRVKEIRELQNNPEAFAERLDSLTEGFYDEAPQTAAAAQMTAVRALQYLASKLPPEPSMGVLGGKWVTPQTDVAAFNRSYDVVEGGAEYVLELARAGRVKASDVEAIQTVYPEQYARLVASLMFHAAGRDLTGQTLQVVQTLVGAPVTALQSPAAVNSLQSAFAAAGQGQGVQPMHGRQKTIDLSARYSTGVDADGPVGERSA